MSIWVDLLSAVVEKNSSMNIKNDFFVREIVISELWNEAAAHRDILDMSRIQAWLVSLFTSYARTAVKGMQKKIVLSYLNLQGATAEENLQ